ncbi:MAG: prepilin-type N-terminal cleavage/methylation domain-containing protein [Patescibacteria group bacterium]|nr:prepilin-type N-terminal cleavage/methylation domain-containing protein [Patescibacteria group bacterium]
MEIKTKRGFTLIELLVVIAIIGILSSVVLASLNTARLKSRDTRRVADIKQLQLALALYFDSNGAYPTSLGPLKPTYIATLPSDPLTSGAANLCSAGTESGCYKYSALGSGTTCSSYHLGATLEDGTNQALNSDVDAAAGTACTGSAADFAGTDPVYDVKP